MDPTAYFRGDLRVATRRQLLALGVDPRALASAVRTGLLLRVRRGYYALPTTETSVIEAVRIGGRVSCVSAAELQGVWVPNPPFAHVSLAHTASRLRSPRSRFVRLSPDNLGGCELHWWPLLGQVNESVHSVSLIDSLAHIIRCQPRPIAVAALDSALFEKKIASADLDQIFGGVPAKFRLLRGDIDARCMSGLETIVRLMMLDAGLSCVPQVWFARVGCVDLVVEGCVVVETDGHRGHDGAEASARDYARDTELAALGYIVLRFNYRQVMFQPDAVMAAILGALRSHVRYVAS
jgi:very-short-patch-repair endonuclease